MYGLWGSRVLSCLRVPGCVTDHRLSHGHAVGLNTGGGATLGMALHSWIEAGATPVTQVPEGLTISEVAGPTMQINRKHRDECDTTMDCRGCHRRLLMRRSPLWTNT
jgi:hypothetical protein